MQKSSVQYITIEPGFSSQRVDNFLLTRLKGVPKTRIYRLLRKGEVRVNKKRVGPDYRLQEGDLLRIPPLQLPDKPVVIMPSQSLTALLKQRILFEDKNLLIINKPSGIPVHGGSQVKIGIIEALRSMYPKLVHLELAHRLDAGTSGCLVFAKKRSILKELHGMFREGQVKKIYWALTKGHWESHTLRVDAPLHKNYLSGGERIVKVDPQGKKALTIFRPLKIFKEHTLVEAKLMTGRTHQIRVHAQSEGHPIAGDDKYGDATDNKKLRQSGLKRLFLHAYSVEFSLLSMDEPLTIKVMAPLDEDLEKCLMTLKPL